MKALLDSDILVYKVGFSSQRTSYRFVSMNGAKIEFGDMPLHLVKKDLKQKGITASEGKLQRLISPIQVEFAFQRMRMLIESILDKTDADSYHAFLTSTDHSNYRYNIAKLQEYKGNRKNMKRPVHYDVLRDYLVQHYNAEVIYNQEADDAMGIMQTKYTDSTIMCSIDKDLDMIPGYHYNMDTDEIYVATDPGTLRIDDNRHKLIGRGLKWFYAQMLLGDSADNIPGIPGYGPVRVHDVLAGLNTEQEMIEATRAIYLQYYKGCANINYKEVCDLLWIRRHEGEIKSEMI